MPRPMRVYKPPTLTCALCGGRLRPSAFGGWVHEARQKITDPSWHVPKVAA
jgi:hypothetical protein